MKTLLVCGGRDFGLKEQAYALLDDVHARYGVQRVIHGDAPGAGHIGRDWATARGLKVDAFPADWDKLGAQAGPIRNGQMLKEGAPDIVIAFPGGPGSRDMVDRTQRAGIRLIQVFG